MEGRLENAAAVHLHLESCPSCMEMCAALGQSLTPPLSVSEGQKVGPYLLETRLGHGGMGVVFRARDTRLGRTVAVKLILPHILDDEQVRERFRREARAAGALDHPNLCRVLDVGDEPPHLVLAFVEGETLRQRLATALPLATGTALPLPVGEALAILRQLAAGLGAAHRAGIVHRDIKPSNVMVDRAGQVKILDFGLAKLHDESRSLTRSGDVLGTAAYMAPEQHQGAEVGPAADVWAVGALAWELLGGKPPFQAGTQAALARAVLDEEPTPLPSSLPAQLRAILQKCLEKDPARRYADANALGADLEQLALGHKVGARDAPLRRTLRRGRRFFLAVGAALALVGALAAGLWGLHQRRAADQRARMAERVGRAIQEMRGRMRSAYLMPVHDITPEREAVRAQLRELEAAQVDDAARGPAEYAMGEGWLSLRDHEKARSHFAAAEAAGESSANFQLSYGLTLGQLYVERLAKTFSLPVGAPRRAATEKLEKELRDPALAHLRAAEGKGDLPRDYVEALIARYERRFDDSVKLAHAAFAAAPLFYEAGQLEAEALVQTGQLADDKARGSGLPFMQRAVERLGPVLEIARSDPKVYRARAWALGYLGIRMGAQEAARMSPYAKAAEDLDLAIRIDPLDASLWSLNAGVRIQQADFLGMSGKSMHPPIDDALKLALKATELDPKLAEAWTMLADIRTLLWQEGLEHGEDDAAKLELARQAYQRVLALGVSNINSYINYSRLDRDEAGEKMKRGEDPTPHSCRGHQDRRGGRGIAVSVRRLEAAGPRRHHPRRLGDLAGRPGTRSDGAHRRGAAVSEAGAGARQPRHHLRRRGRPRAGGHPLGAPPSPGRQRRARRQCRHLPALLDGRSQLERLRSDAFVAHRLEAAAAWEGMPLRRCRRRCAPSSTASRTIPSTTCSPPPPARSCSWPSGPITRSATHARRWPRRRSWRRRRPPRTPATPTPSW